MLYTKELAEQLKKAINDVVIKAEDVVEDIDYTFDVIATTQDVDRDGEIILVSGWDTKNWLKNPVILANHNYTIESIIGKGYKFYEKDGVMRLKGVFSSTNPLGVLARQLYAEGMLQTVSVGFLAKKRNDQNYKIIEEAELLEVSFVAVPCNPNAVRVGKELLQEAIEKGLIVAEKSLSQDDTIESKLKVLLKEEKNIDESDKEGIYIVALYNSEFVYNYYSYESLNSFEKYLRRGYNNKDGAIELVGEDIEVQAQTEWIDKKSLSNLYSDMKDIKIMLQSLADDKVKKEQMENEVLKAKEQKEFLQNINKATALALENLKKLSS